MKNPLRKYAQRLGLLTPSYNERAFGIPRRWSNTELRRVGHLFKGDIVNVSAWQDRDKEAGTYRDYFPNGGSYTITNFGTSQGELQGAANEEFLDLSQSLPERMLNRFDVVFNHTTLEHIFDFQTAFHNLCAMSRDIVIVVVPWLQPMHADYGDFWRFSPQAVPRLFSREGLTTLHLSWNQQPRASVYVFAIASRQPASWAKSFPSPILDPWSNDSVKLSSNSAGRAVFGG
jgi:hypothetical protein